MMKRALGFTLIELITAIVVLAIVALGVSTYLGLGTQIYTDAAARDQIVSSARFVIERLNREVREALPNSARVVDYSTNSCLEFTPIISSAIYSDIPVVPEAVTTQVEFVEQTNRFESEADAVGLDVIVYPLDLNEIYEYDNNKRFLIDAADFSGTTDLLTLDSAVNFSADSPTERMFFIGNSTMYCLEEVEVVGPNITIANVVRYEVESWNGNGDPLNVINENLMAENLHLENSFFTVSEATFLRNATVEMRLTFLNNNESVTFNNEVQITNVP